jgi:hypothetical protein
MRTLPEQVEVATLRLKSGVERSGVSFGMDEGVKPLERVKSAMKRTGAGGSAGGQGLGHVATFATLPEGVSQLNAECTGQEEDWER